MDAQISVKSDYGHWKTLGDGLNERCPNRRKLPMEVAVKFVLDNNWFVFFGHFSLNPRDFRGTIEFECSFSHGFTQL